MSIPSLDSILTQTSVKKIGTECRICWYLACFNVTFIKETVSLLPSRALPELCMNFIQKSPNEKTSLLKTQSLADPCHPRHIFFCNYYSFFPLLFHTHTLTQFSSIQPFIPEFSPNSSCLWLSAVES